MIGIGVHDLRVDLVSMLVTGLNGNTDAAVHVQRALERGVGLKAHDGLALGVRGVDIACAVRSDAGHHIGIHVERTAALALLLKKSQHVIPKVGRALRGAHKERLVALVRRIVALDEVAHIHFVLPDATRKTVPCAGLRAHPVHFLRLLHAFTLLNRCALGGALGACATHIAASSVPQKRQRNGTGGVMRDEWGLFVSRNRSHEQISRSPMISKQNSTINRWLR